MRKRMLLALLLAMTLLLSSCSLIVKDEKVDNARPVLQVGDIVYTKGEVQEQVDLQLSYTQMIYNMYLGQYLDVTDPEIVADARNMVIESLTQEAVITSKARERGLDVLTDEEQAQLEQAVQASWQEYRDSFSAELSLPETASHAQREAAIDALCAAEGIDLESIRDTETLRLLDEKLQSDVIRDVTVSEESLQAELDLRAEEARADYEASPSAYGSDVLNGAAVYYRPTGYRNVRQILVQFTDEDTALIEAIDDAYAAQQQRAADSMQTLTDLGVADFESLAAKVTVTLDEAAAVPGDVSVREVVTAFDTELSDDVKEAVKRLAESRALQDFYSRQVTDIQAQAYANIDAEADQVLAALAAGEDWNALSAAHNDDPGMTPGAEFAETGYPVCEGFTDFDPAFVQAAMAIPSVGGWSGKVPGSYGYYIIQYTADVAQGPVSLSDVRDELYEDVLTAAQDEAYSTALAQWIAEADVKIDLKPLDD